MRHFPNILFIYLLLLFSCQHNTEKKVRDDLLIQMDTLTVQVDTLDSNLKKIQGFWIMSEYFDGILKRRAIQGRYYEISYLMISFGIFKDSLFSYGLTENRKILIQNQFDSIIPTGRNLFDIGSYQFSYDENKDLIIGKQVQTPYSGKKLDPMTYTFRRLKESEKCLVDGNSWKKWGFQTDLWHNCNAFFVDSLLRGEYKPLNGNGPSFVLGALNKVYKSPIGHGKTSGFKDYHSYYIHSNFGTAHPYDGEDVIVFNGPNGIYSWKIKQDTLELTEMQLKKDSEYFFENGTKKYRFVKIKNH